MKSKHLFITVMAIVLVFTMVLAACGGEDGNPSGGGSPSATNPYGLDLHNSGRHIRGVGSLSEITVYYYYDDDDDYVDRTVVAGYPGTYTEYYYDPYGWLLRQDHYAGNVLVEYSINEYRDYIPTEQNNYRADGTLRRHAELTWSDNGRTCERLEYIEGVKGFLEIITYDEYGRSREQRAYDQNGELVYMVTYVYHPDGSLDTIVTEFFGSLQGQQSVQKYYYDD